MKVFFNITHTKLYFDDKDEFWCEKEWEETRHEFLERIEDAKQEYYDGEFWHDCDHLKIKWVGSFQRYEIDWEIIVDKYAIDWEWEIIYPEDIKYDTRDLIEKILKHYMSKDWKKWSIDAEFDRWDWDAQLQNWDKMDIVIKYRGWRWYTYAFWGYNFSQFKK